MKVMIWDDHQSRCIEEILFWLEVHALRLWNDRVVIVLEQKIFVYKFAEFKLLHEMETIANLKGLCALSATSSPFIAGLSS
jgi:hypothetical protein